jgi:hypothetical protein
MSKDAWDEARGIAPDCTGDLSSEAFIRRARDDWEVDMAPEPWQVEVFALVSAADALRIAVIAMGLDASTELRRMQVHDTIGRIERLIAEVTI